jgi:hypothetical protein
MQSPRRRRSRGSEGLVTVENVNVPGHKAHVNAAKYGALRRALLKVVPRRRPGVTQAEMFAAVRKHLPEGLFPSGAKANWWAKTVQLDLEAKGLLERSSEGRPLRWNRVD